MNFIKQIFVFFIKEIYHNFFWNRQWDTELAKRLEDFQTGKAVAEPSDKIFSELRKKYS
ncbi:MAG: hypothetical protein KME64_08270 [Scytonematopsis contorta HA4267-MV1]|jgi:hypothetical protein|nr:hypothetical protein [Scytonematopsis contorta HA4267-MV1]